jgi:HemY protein
MRYIFSVIVAMLIAIGLASFLKNDPGLFVFNYAGYTVQMSFALFVVMMLLTVLLLYFLISTLFGIYKTPKNYRQWNKHRQAKQSERNITQGLSFLIQGEWKKAEKIFIKGANISSQPMLNYLFAAKAAQQLGNIDRRDQHLLMAQEYNDDESLMVGLTQAELQLEQKQTDQAYATLIHTNTNTKGQAQAKKLMLQASIELKEWSKVIEILNEIDAKKLMPKDVIHAKRLEAYAGSLIEAALSPTKDELCVAWKQIARKLQNEIYLIDVYVTERIRFPNTGDCEEILRKSLKKVWDGNLIRLYGLVEGVDSVKQYAFAEKLINSHARDPVLLLTLGRLSLRSKDLEKARTYFEECLEIKPNAEVYKELAVLLERQGDQTTAAIYFQEGLVLATGLPGTGDVRLLQNNAESETNATQISSSIAKL